MLNVKYLCNNNDPDEPPQPSEEVEPIEPDWDRRSEDEPLETR